MNNPLSFLTATTCGLACWWAEQEACHCSCGGAAHGVLAMGGTQPRRNCLISGVRYVLGAVNGDWGKINHWAHEVGDHDTYGYAVGPRRNDPGAIWWNKTATDTQCEKWPELLAYRDFRRKPWETDKPNKPSLEWIREDYANEFDAWLKEQEAE